MSQAMLLLWSFSLLHYSWCPLDRLICVASLLWFLEHDLPPSPASPFLCYPIVYSLQCICSSLSFYLMGPSFHATVLCATSRPSWFSKDNLSAAFVWCSLLFWSTQLFTSFSLLSCPLSVFSTACDGFDFSLVLISLTFHLLSASSMLCCQCWLFGLEAFCQTSLRKF